MAENRPCGNPKIYGCGRHPKVSPLHMSIVYHLLDPWGGKHGPGGAVVESEQRGDPVPWRGV
eukprot:3097410-Pyramimonas_sp.AAC.1